MDGRESAAELIESLRRATTLVASVGARAVPCPHDADAFDWSADALDELARLVSAVAPAVEGLTSRRNDVLGGRATDLATAIVAHRNALMSPEPAGDGCDDVA